jgi:hypothetical protein
VTPAEREVLQEFSTRMWALQREANERGDVALASRYGTLHDNAQRMIKTGGGSPTLRKMFKRNLDDLQRYEEGFYDRLVKMLG